MTKNCPKCSTKNSDNSTFCRYCGKRLPNSTREKSADNNGNSGKKQMILVGVIVALLIIIAIIGTYTYVLSTEDNSDSNNTPTSSVNQVSNTETKSWHKVDSFSGVGDKTITLNSAGNRIRVTSSAMPIKNYADNFMYTTVTRNGYDVASSQLSWNSRSAVATKSDNIEFTGAGTYYIYVSAYELQYWNLEIYEYY